MQESRTEVSESKSGVIMGQRHLSTCGWPRLESKGMVTTDFIDGRCRHQRSEAYIRMNNTGAVRQGTQLFFFFFVGFCTKPSSSSDHNREFNVPPKCGYFKNAALCFTKLAQIP